MLYLLDAQESKFYATPCLRLVLAVKSKCVWQVGSKYFVGFSAEVMGRNCV